MVKTNASIHTILLQVDASSIYFGLNWTHCTGPASSHNSSAVLFPVSACHTWIFPSVEPIEWKLKIGKTVKPLFQMINIHKQLTTLHLKFKVKKYLSKLVYTYACHEMCICELW